MQEISDKCNRESCRFCAAGICTEQKQRHKCLELLQQIIPDPEDRITFALSEQVIKD